MRCAPEGLTAVIREQSRNELSFNVMPDMVVRESLMVHEYRIGDHYIEAYFDREYHTDMKASPSHLIFLSVLIHWQKLVYLYFCHHQGLDYENGKIEKFKVWPTKINISLPNLVRQEKNLVQQVWVDSVKKLPNGSWHLRGETRVDSIVMTGDTMILPLG